MSRIIRTLISAEDQIFLYILQIIEWHKQRWGKYPPTSHPHNLNNYTLNVRNKSWREVRKCRMKYICDWYNDILQWRRSIHVALVVLHWRMSVESIDCIDWPPTVWGYFCLHPRLRGRPGARLITEDCLCKYKWWSSTAPPHHLTITLGVWGMSGVSVCVMCVVCSCVLCV